MNAGSIGLLLGRQYVRSSFLMALIVVVPLLFLNLAYVATKNVDIPVLVTEGNARLALAINQPSLHVVISTPMLAAFLSGIAGLFVTLDARKNDERLRIAGVTIGNVAAMRLLMIATFAVVVAILSVAISLIQVRPDGLLGVAAGTVLVSVSYAWIGAIVSVLVGRLGGAYVMLLLPVLDIGTVQNPMLISGDQALWMKFLPGFGGARFAVDAAFSQGTDDWNALVIGLAWAAALGVGTAFILRRRPQ